MGELISAAASLARADPNLWGRFCTALENFAAEATTNFVASDVASLQINQGRVQAYLLIHRTCKNAVNKYEEMESGRG